MALRSALSALRRAVPVALLCAATGAASTTAVSLREPASYAADAAVLVGTSGADTTDEAIAGLHTAELLLKTYVAVALSAQGRGRIIDALRKAGEEDALVTSSLDIVTRPGALVLEVRTTSRYGDNAEAVAAAATSVLLDTIRNLNQRNGVPLAAAVVDEARGSARQLPSNTVRDAALGALVGLGVGAAAGAWVIRRDRRQWKTGR